ncbi:MAG: hypothetical protein LUE27_08235 [Clostridia bacterium]|nr:hypothetical protein [Clostridia bacterium]
MNIYDIIFMPENVEGMKKLFTRMEGGNVTDNDVRTALLALADSVSEYEPDDAEIKVRFAKYRENPKSTFALNVLISGLSYKTLRYAARYKNGRMQIQVRRTGEKKMDSLIVYTSEEATNVPSLDDATFYDTDLDDIIKVCEENELRFILFNPEKDNVKISVSSIEEALETFYEMDEFVSTSMEQGVLGEDLFPELLEALVHDHVKVLMKDNKEFIGDVMPWRRDRPVMEQMLTVRTQAGENISVLIPDIMHICSFMDDFPPIEDFEPFSGPQD